MWMVVVVSISSDLATQLFFLFFAIVPKDKEQSRVGRLSSLKCMSVCNT